MANRPPGLGRGGRGAALMHLLQEQARTPGDVQAGSSQQSAAPAAPGGQVQPGVQAAGPQQEAGVPPPSAPAAATPPLAAVQPPPSPVVEAQAAASGQSAVTMGRGNRLQQLHDAQLAQQQQQQQPVSLSATPSETSLETAGKSLTH